jgi:tripartite-type tricarboxylate transporter receptor subunit TctC
MTLISDRRTFLGMSGSAVAMPLVARSAWALDYPTRPVNIIEPIGVSSVPDIIIRTIAPHLSEKLGHEAAP